MQPVRQGKQPLETPSKIASTAYNYCIKHNFPGLASYTREICGLIAGNSCIFPKICQD
jgi:hypothetical protein